MGLFAGCGGLVSVGVPVFVFRCVAAVKPSRQAWRSTGVPRLTCRLGFEPTLLAVRRSLWGCRSLIAQGFFMLGKSFPFSEGTNIRSMFCGGRERFRRVERERFGLCCDEP